ncbi:polymer-forming cytoskeletal protein [Marinimicrobium sp. ABcell2]|uniref:bactofilin family protein n=1 Tax=Marinimicrobium sp. ABcell2 TaxID=3069751 RepID=UPI0027B77570|nr:polymer-forming cytoskeletal protein [Marinimicrobium sp. ABcell2]MDQ2075849.1 polymer-forming cytoskeletal protein [Marinimicrobium sp. ABcell2]
MRLNKNDSEVDQDDFANEPVIGYARNVNSGSASAARNAERAEAPASSPAAVIGSKITFKGELMGEEDLLIQGRVEGTIDLKGNHLTIGPQGSIKANVTAKTITIEGTIEGDIFAQERIAIKTSSNVRGNVKAERVTLEDGAKFRGSIDMDMEPEPVAEKPKTSLAVPKQDKAEALPPQAEKQS